MVSENVSSTTGSSRGAAVRGAITACALLRPTLHARLARASDAPVGASRRSIACARGRVPVPCTWKIALGRQMRFAFGDAGRKPHKQNVRRASTTRKQRRPCLPAKRAIVRETRTRLSRICVPRLAGPVARNRRLGTLAKPRRERVERRQRGQRFAIARAVAGQFSNLLKLLYNPLGNGVTVAQQTLTLFV